jgi:regulator of protease activity HflC (stomatin/prohibitin superfamily)
VPVARSHRMTTAWDRGTSSVISENAITLNTDRGGANTLPFPLAFNLTEIAMKSAFVTLWVIVGLSLGAWMSYSTSVSQESNSDVYYRQFEDSDAVAERVRHDHWQRNSAFAALGAAWAITGAVVLLSWTKPRKTIPLAVMLVTLTGATGCYRPFEPVDLQVISPNEEAFLIPLTGDSTKQASVSPEDFLRKNMVMAKQVRIPQQWVPTGYETFGPSGSWRAAATLIKVDRSPVTREWTADTSTGTSNKNEAIWVMTSDQVEFSTGWTCTARIKSRDDAVLFLSNYPNGTLSNVMDQEIRAKLQTEFGLEVTDLVMDELRKNATPHITKVMERVEKFFMDRGVTITNLGITGGFVYKDKSIQDMLVKVFNAEQEKNIQIAKTQAQLEENKQIALQAEGKAKAILTEKKAEADGIKSIADAKSYEISKAKEDLATYINLKQIELELKKTEKWDGKFPLYFMGGTNPSVLLQAPIPAVAKNP